MNNLIDCINIRSIIEELDNNDKQYYILNKETDEYFLYFDKHLLKRKSRHSDWNNSNYISNKSILDLFNRGYKKIVDKYQSNKLKYSKSGKEAFLLTNKKTDLNIIGFIYKLNNDGKYDICLKSVMYNNSFKAKNNNGFKTIQILIESINNLIIVEIDE